MLDKYLDNFYFEDVSEDDVPSTDSEEVIDKSLESKNSDESKEVSSSDNDAKEEVLDDTSVDSSESADSSSEKEESVVVDAELADNQNTSDDSDDFVLPFLIGKKIGMTQLFSNQGTSYPVTVIEAGPCTVLQIKNTKNDGYNSVQLGYSDKKESKTTKSLMGHFKKSKSSPKSHLKEFRSLDIVENISLGDTVTVNQFSEGDYVTVTGVSKGKGFAGHMKRHGFGGGRASHGKNSVMRKAGSVGAGTSPGRIFPGMKMAGRMGNQKVSVKNLSVVNIDKAKNLIFVSGAIPGANNKIVYLTKS